MSEVVEFDVLKILDIPKERISRGLRRGLRARAMLYFDNCSINKEHIYNVHSLEKKYLPEQYHPELEEITKLIDQHDCAYLRITTS